MENTKSKFLQFSKSFLPFFIIQVIVQILVLLMGLSFQNNDSREVLANPILQIILLVVFFAYSFLFAVIDQIHPSTSKRIIQFSTILGVALIFHAYMFFSVEIDGLAIENNLKELTLYQFIATSNVAIFWIMALFLVVQIISRLKAKSSSI